MFICSCVWATHFLSQVFPWQVLFAGVNELTSFLWQVFTVASNTTTQQTRKKTTTRRQFRFFIMAHAYLTREKRLLAWGLGCALLMQYEHSKRHMNRRWWVRPWATQRGSQSLGFASNLIIIKRKGGPQAKKEVGDRKSEVISGCPWPM